MIGKLLGAYFGYSLTHASGFGLIGLMLGIWLGAKFDRGYADVHNHSGPFFFSMNHSKVQKIFFEASFSVMGHIAKSDGVVSENEIRVAESFMQQLNMSMAARKEARVAFRRGKQPEFDLQKELYNLVEVCGGQVVLLRLFIDIQHKAAAADGMTPSKVALLEKINQYLGFSHSYSHNYSGRQNSGSELEQSYKLLGVNSSDSDSVIKTAYRKLMRKNHPDKLISQGLPKEMIKIANEKTAAIQDAYRTIQKYRGIK